MAAFGGESAQEIPRAMARRIYDRVEELAADPRPNGSEKIVGGEDEYRVREGDYRIVYSVDDTTVVVEVLRVGHRREVYR